MNCNVLFILLSLAASTGWAQSAPPAPVVVDEARMDTFSAALWVSGTVISRHDARIAAETDGRITWVAEVGTRIGNGEPFAIIDDTDLQLDLRDNQAQLESLQAQMRYQENNLKRLNQLAASNNASVNQRDEAQSQMDMTVQEIRRAEVTIARTQRRIDQTRVLAPFPGVVVERLVQAGEFVSRGMQVARLVDTENREIRAQAPLGVASFIREGLEVSVKHEGRQSLSPVKRVIPVGDERSRMFEVRIAADDPAWIIGSPVRVALPNSNPRELVAIPRDALVLRGSEMFVLRVTADNTVEKISVDTGIGLGKLIEVIGDVFDGDRIVTRGAERLQPGQLVVISGGT
ncbi:MAG: efflux RND transporter periplasmic adaptor subunit [Proteobacteria bacterium]|nr:efflux RND transporter periplasmic adaptor subunit [Pseudomonadota bacterium]